MSTERKTMISARLPAALIARVDFVARNIDTEAVKNRSAAGRRAEIMVLRSVLMGGKL